MIVTAGAQPIAGVTVIFHAPDGAITDRQVTDAAGQASSAVAPGGQVSIVRAENDTVAITTFRAIAPGDTLHVRVRGDTVATAMVTLPGPITGGQGYGLVIGSVGAPGNLSVPSTVPVLAAAVPEADGIFVVYGFADSNGLAAWSRAEGSVASPDVTLPAWSTTVDSIPFTVSDPNAIVDSYIVDRGVSVLLPDGPITGTPTVAAIRSPASAWGVSALSGDFGSPVHRKLINMRTATQPTMWTLDFAASPPEPAGLVLGGTPQRPTLRFNRGGGSSPVTRVVFGWTPPSGGPPKYWEIYDGDSAITSLDAPELPADVGGPDAATTISSWGVEVIECDRAAAYSDVLGGALEDDSVTDRVFRSTATYDQLF